MAEDQSQDGVALGRQAKMENISAQIDELAQPQ